MSKTATVKRGRPSAPKSESFIKTLLEDVEVPHHAKVQKGKFEIGIHVRSICDVIALCKQGKMRGYRYNRGTGRITPKVVNSIANDLKPHALGLITISEDGDTIDGHHRLGGLSMRAKIGLMTKEDWDALIPISVVRKDQFIETYKYLGDCKAHSINDHLSNPDLLLGSCIVGPNGLHSYLAAQKCSGEEMKVFESASYLTTVANVMTAIHLINSGEEDEKSIKSYCDVYRVRRRMKDLARATKDEECQIVHPNDYNRVSEGCRYYAQFKIALRTIKAEDDALPCIKKLSNNKGLMGLIISDVVFNANDRKLTRETPETLASRLLHRAHKVEERLAPILGTDERSSKKAYRYITALAQRPLKGI